MKNSILKPIKQIARKLIFPTPSHLLNNQIQLDRDGLQAIEKSIKENFHTGWRSEDKYSMEMYESDLNDHLFLRLEHDRRIIIPWLDNASTLQDKRILEIGCGTGSSTVALAEQGAKVTGIDLDEGALIVAKDRLKTYGLEAKLRVSNAVEILSTIGANDFDFIIFFACLEHMTIDERLISLRNAWEMLRARGLLVIVETPNRLWYFDRHTSMLPFFHWLPNELAFQYSSFSSKANFHELYREYNAKSKEHFLRRGRGVSFHELDMAIGRVNDLNVITSLSTFQGIRYKLKKSKLDRQYKSILMSIAPDIHEGFFDEYLDLIIEKKSLASGR